MFGSDLYIALILGVLLSLIFAEKTGIVPAGLVVPGYLGLVFNQPVFILLVLLVSLLTYVIVKYGLSKFMILYGRRKFAAMLITGIVLKIAFDSLYPIVPFEIAEFRGIGIIVPGLIANTIQKQGLTITFGSTLLLSGATFAIMFVYYLI
ncbi:poly-gamma-glutamate biosynthesis protein PgsC [Bacillus spizizenii ATCC 6633 = JCM 2499]|uniref:Capsular polyglutamate amide ligase/translocase subunit n=1 Tax=Bacillus spizizenii (strain ATCC 23059 / NRRL B-14472 / W23) TaxID=655816 RepID=E0U4Z2_BACSH|nr:MULTISPECIES: poly-gamma-glutamate biosynthesis protein PgsC [Bacillus subtilis group]ADM39563.1 capsular polyglutamate amide ligase/translocase subunit [Bacillus spizizenii str. W23]AJW85035.1 capsular biosynthesis protein [Bacillus spizizenii]EFG93332.1 capsular polyglutamate amide ligase/translocase subunit [Bacillus spizizenii ATCC 6633 = JCM 2499]KFK77851.1 poly-gamma-glutamate biosynthesis protein PgsC [Bacillus spizizenii]MBE0171530.1 poly-gamma-glutamate biosynthesis protein PgsC [B